MNYTSDMEIMGFVRNSKDCCFATDKKYCLRTSLSVKVALNNHKLNYEYFFNRKNLSFFPSSCHKLFTKQSRRENAIIFIVAKFLCWM